MTRTTFVTLRSFRTECVRLKNFVVEAEITGNTIKYCGVYDFAYGDGGKNGEGIYIGTSSTQVSRGWEGCYFFYPVLAIDVHANITEPIVSYLAQKFARVIQRRDY